MTQVNNGLRVAVSLPDFVGMAGFVERDGVWTLSYRPNLDRPLKIGRRVTIDGRDAEVVAIGESKVTKGFQVVTLRPAG